MYIYVIIIIVYHISQEAVSTLNTEYNVFGMHILYKIYMLYIYYVSHQFSHLWSHAYMLVAMAMVFMTVPIIIDKSIKRGKCTTSHISNSHKIIS